MHHKTSTFTRFQASQKVNATTGTHTGVDNISVAGPTVADANFGFSITASTDTYDTGSLILSTVEEVSNAKKLKSYTLDAGLQRVPYTPHVKQGEEDVKPTELQYVHYQVTITGTFADTSLTDEAEAAMLTANTYGKKYTLTMHIGGTSAARGRIGTTLKAAAADDNGTAITGTSDLTWTYNIEDFATNTFTHSTKSHVYSKTLDFYFRAEGENKTGDVNNADSALSFTLTATGNIADKQQG